MKRRDFIKTTGSVAGLSFVGCGLGALSGCSEDSHGGERREVIVNGTAAKLLGID